METGLKPERGSARAELVAAIEREDAARVGELLRSDGAWRELAGAAAPLDLALALGAAECALECVKAGADPLGVPSGEWAGCYLDWAMDRGIGEIYRRPKKAGEAAGEADIGALPERWMSLCVALLAAGADPNCPDRDGVTPLMSACIRDQEELARLLLENGARMELKEKYGHTALVCASAQGSLRCQRLLIERGADLSARSLNGSGIARRALSFGLSEKGARCVIELIEAGAELETPEGDGKSALDMMREKAGEEGEIGERGRALVRAAEKRLLEKSCASASAPPTRRPGI